MDSMLSATRCHKECRTWDCNLVPGPQGSEASQEGGQSGCGTRLGQTAGPPTAGAGAGTGVIPQAAGVGGTHPVALGRFRTKGRHSKRI